MFLTVIFVFDCINGIGNFNYVFPYGACRFTVLEVFFALSTLLVFCICDKHGESPI